MKASVRNYGIVLVPSTAILLAAIILLVSCSGSGGEGESNTTDGGIRVNLVWEERSRAVSSLGRPMESRDVCENYAIETIAADVVDSVGDIVASASWPCSDHQGTIENVPAGTGHTVEVMGYVSGRVDWVAQVHGVEVEPGKITETPPILMEYTGDDREPPEVAPIYPNHGDDEVPLDVVVRISLSEPIVRATINTSNFILTDKDNGQIVPTGLDYDGNAKPPLLEMRPLQPLVYPHAYRVTVSAEIEDFAGHNMTSDRSWEFTTAIPKTWYKDSDRDDYSDGAMLSALERPSGEYYLAGELIAVSGDCNDEDPLVNPGAEEICDDKDNDCDGEVLVCLEWFKDRDGDRYADGPPIIAPVRPSEGYYAAEDLISVSGDCNDEDPLVNPGAEEICDDKDNDCDGEILICLGWYKDTDSDGYSDGVVIVASERPGDAYYEAEELRQTDGDCNDDDPDIHPGAEELCDNIDNDCDGDVDGEHCDVLVEVLVIERSESRLLTVKPFTGETVTDHGRLVPEEDFCGLAFVPEQKQLFALSRYRPSLYSIDPQSLEVTRIGEVPIDLEIDGVTDVGGLAYDTERGRLSALVYHYAKDNSERFTNLVRLDRENATVSEIGRVSGELVCHSLTYDMDKDVLYAYCADGPVGQSPEPANLVQINPENADTERLLDSGFYDIAGLAKRPGKNGLLTWLRGEGNRYAEVVPEPPVINDLAEAGEKAPVFVDAMLYKDFEVGISEWTRLFGSETSDYGQDIVVDSVGNMYVVGFTYGDYYGERNAGAEDMLVMKLDPDGNRLWSHLVGSDQRDLGYGVAVAENGDVYAVGITWIDSGEGSGQWDVLLARFNGEGNLLQRERYGSAAYDMVGKVAVDDANGIVWVAGTTKGDHDGQKNAGSDDLFLARFQRDLTWSATTLIGSTQFEEFEDMALDREGFVYLTGDTFGNLGDEKNAGGADAFIVIVDPGGKWIGTRLFGTSTTDIGWGIVVGEKGNIYVVGETSGSFPKFENAGGADVFIARFDRTLDPGWLQQIGSDADELGRDVAVDPEGNIYVTGVSGGDLLGWPNAGNEDFFFVVYNDEGQLMRFELNGTEGMDYALRLAISETGKGLITGFTSGRLDGQENAGWQDLFVRKVAGPPF